MDKAAFYSTVFSMGLTIGSDQMVYTEPDDAVGYEFFRLNGDVIKPVMGNEMKISSVESIYLDDSGTVLIVETIGDKTIPIRGRVRGSVQASRSGNRSSIKMPKTDSELNDLFPILYPDYTSKLFYDIMMEREIVDVSLFDSTAPEGSFVDMDESIEILYYDNIERKLKDFGCSGTPPSTTVRLRVLLGRIYACKRNLFKEWVLAHKWDGVQRVDTWFKDVFGATAPPLVESGLEDIYLAKVSRAWFTGAIRRMDQEIVHEVVPVLISPQGKCRKTSGLRYTAGKDRWFKDVLSEVTSTQGIAKFLDAARGKVIIELAESTAIRTKDQDALKAFISMSSDQYRKPYARREQSWPRHFIMAATSNLDDVFTDLTGNRRYYPMYCTPSDFTYRTKYNVEQVWAEAYLLAKNGEPSYVDSEWAPAKIMQLFATQENPNVMSIDNFLNDPMNGFTKVGRETCKDEVMAAMFHLSKGEVPSKDMESAYRAWRRGTKYWATMDKMYHYDGRWVKGVRRIKVPEDARKNGLVLTDEDADQIRAEFQSIALEEGADIGTVALKAFNTIVLSNDMRYENEVFDPGDMTEDMIQWLVDSGYLYRKNGKLRVITYDV